MLINAILHNVWYELLYPLCKYSGKSHHLITSRLYKDSSIKKTNKGLLFHTKMFLGGVIFMYANLYNFNANVRVWRFDTNGNINMLPTECLIIDRQIPSNSNY